MIQLYSSTKGICIPPHRLFLNQKPWLCCSSVRVARARTARAAAAPRWAPLLALALFPLRRARSRSVATATAPVAVPTTVTVTVPTPPPVSPRARRPPAAPRRPLGAPGPGPVPPSGLVTSSPRPVAFVLLLLGGGSSRQFDRGFGFVFGARRRGCGALGRVGFGLLLRGLPVVV